LNVNKWKCTSWREVIKVDSCGWTWHKTHFSTQIQSEDKGRRNWTEGETTLKQEKVYAFEAYAWSLCARMEFDLQVGANPIKSRAKPWSSSSLSET
jgi:hypothetical protein